MRTIKDARLALVPLPFSVAGESGVLVTAMAAFSGGSGETPPDYLPESAIAELAGQLAAAGLKPEETPIPAGDAPVATAVFASGETRGGVEVPSPVQSAETPWARLDSLADDGAALPIDVPLGLNGVYLFPERDQGIMVWRGIVDTPGLAEDRLLAARAGFADSPAALSEAPEPLAAVVPPPPVAPPAPPPAPLPEEFAPAAAATKDAGDAMGGDAPESGDQPETPDEPMTTEKFLSIMSDLVDEAVEYDDMLQGGDELRLVNEILVEHDLEPMDEETYRRGYLDLMEDFRTAAEKVPDKVFEFLTNKAPADEEQAARLLADKLSEAGVEPGEAEALAREVFEPFDIDENTTTEQFCAQYLGIDIGELEERLAELEDTAYEGGRENEMNGVLTRELGAPLEQLLRDDGGEFSLDNIEGILDTLFPDEELNRMAKEELARQEAEEALEEARERDETPEAKKAADAPVENGEAEPAAAAERPAPPIDADKGEISVPDRLAPPADIFGDALD